MLLSLFLQIAQYKGLATCGAEHPSARPAQFCSTKTLKEVNGLRNEMWHISKAHGRCRVFFGVLGGPRHIRAYRLLSGQQFAGARGDFYRVNISR